MITLFDGKKVAPGTTLAYVVQGGKLYQNFLGVQWLVTATLADYGLSDDSSVDAVLKAQRDHNQGLDNLATTRGNGFYDRCTGRQCNPL